jgi:dUTP pyrophosphatase
MRIKGYFGPHGAPWVPARLKQKNSDKLLSVHFRIDTAAFYSMAGKKVIYALGVSIHELRKSIGTAIGFGGRMQFYFLRDVELTFETDQGPHTVVIPEMATPFGPYTGQHRKRPNLPSVLGRDILDQYGLIVDKRAGIVMLTDESLAGIGGPNPTLDRESDQEELMQVRIAVTRSPEGEGLPLPQYATPDAAGMDLHAAVEQAVTLQPGERAVISTGLRIALPPGYEAQIRPRSGLARDHGISMVNTPGTIDEGYRGVVSLLLINHGQEPYTIHRGDRVAQMVVAPVVRAVWDEVEELPVSERGEGGFGHTGVRTEE